RVMPYTAAVITGEIVAVAVEGALIAIALKSKRGFAVALIANLYSWAVGELVMRVIAVRLAHYWYR
ncbi:MAG: hypothetical protein ACXWP4_28935, partial [Polyangiales bacterium]